MTLSVALLLSDIAEVKEISTIFRKLDIIPHYYEDLNSFWSGTLEKMPALCIVDVKCMSDGKLVLRDHPLVQAEQMPLLFYYTPQTEPLLFSTYDLFNLGTLKKTSSYEGPLKAILKRINKLMTFERENLNLTLAKNSYLEKIDLLEERNINLQKEDRYRNLATDLIATLEEFRNEADFVNAIEKTFSKVDEFLEYSIVELSLNGQKLISPVLHNKKFRMIPSLWLGQACANGIEIFAQTMATQVAVELMGGELVSLLIKGQKRQPDKMIFIKSKDELFFNAFNWNLLESFLSGLYASYELKLKQELSSENNFPSTFHAMSFLDQFVFGKTVHDPLTEKDTQNNEYRLINLDLSSLIELTQRKGNQRFFWSKFYQEFVNKLEIQTRSDFKVFSNGVYSLSFLVEAKNLDYFFDELKEFANKFFYWKYFETPEGILALDIKPKVTMIPLSSFAYLKKNQNENPIQEQMNKSEAQKKTREIIWGRESINEI
jgi:hypothetical protein